MRSGISVWLDVPLECLARRISSVGTSSRPLLHGESGDAYSKVRCLPPFVDRKCKPRSKNPVKTIAYLCAGIDTLVHTIRRKG